MKGGLKSKLTRVRSLLSTRNTRSTHKWIPNQTTPSQGRSAFSDYSRFEVFVGDGPIMVDYMISPGSFYSFLPQEEVRRGERLHKVFYFRSQHTHLHPPLHLHPHRLHLKEHRLKASGLRSRSRSVRERSLPLT